ncbi:hypothetical protein WMY93_003595 [Mugilogobius chulae]|uniref:ArfGAP with dual PH domains 2 n=1 Tax=Mugilogobius chulae TaxID=88201 RepID=A0AAW0PZT4_9GOBI
MAGHERNKKILLELLKLPDNRACLDCGAPEPDWASCKLGVFLCLNCSGIHRNLSGKVKSIKLDFWEDKLVEFMKANGNAKAREVYEKAVPCHFYRPQQYDCSVLREQWIRSKYERLEFTGETKYPPPPTPQVFMKDCSGRKKKRVHNLTRGNLCSEEDWAVTWAAAHIPERNPHKKPFVYHEKSEDIVTWFNCIRAARYAYLKTAYPTGRDDELIPMITRNYLKEGFMEKTGPLQKETFKRRWFALDLMNRKLLYYKSPLDAEELKSIFIGTECNKYYVKECVPKFSRGNKWKYGVTVDTPERQYVFMCEGEKDQKEWLSALRNVLLRPMTPQDFACEANMNRKK